MNWRLGLCGVGAVLCLGGCQASSGGGGTTAARTPRMRVAKIDTARIMAEMPQYKELQSAMSEDKQAYFNTLASKGDPRKFSREDVDKLRLEAQKKRGEWQKRIVEMSQSCIKEISETTADIAKQKNLDVVVVDPPNAGVVEYIDGQDDITTDVILKLKK